MTQPPNNQAPDQPIEPPVDSDVDLRDPAQRAELHAAHPKILRAIAVGGVIGAEARYGLALALPHHQGTWPWATLLTNLIGCLLIGALMAALASADRPPQLARPFFGVGILGGFTTFSTYALDLREQLGHGHPAAAAAYLLVTLIGGVLAVGLGLRATASALDRS